MGEEDEEWKEGKRMTVQSYVSELGFELATPGSAFRRATDCAMEPRLDQKIILFILNQNMFFGAESNKMVPNHHFRYHLIWSYMARHHILVLFGLTHCNHCRLNKHTHTLQWKSQISVLGMSGYET